MKKKLVTAIITSIIALAVTSSAFAAPRYAAASTNGSCCGTMDTMNDLMWDDNGNLVDRDLFKERLDAAVKNKTISTDDESYYLNMYDYCTNRTIGR